jgi:hypothetical protein
MRNVQHLPAYIFAMHLRSFAPKTCSFYPIPLGRGRRGFHTPTPLLSRFRPYAPRLMVNTPPPLVPPSHETQRQPRDSQRSRPTGKGRTSAGRFSPRGPLGIRRAPDTGRARFLRPRYPARSPLSQFGLRPERIRFGHAALQPRHRGHYRSRFRTPVPYGRR